MGKSPGSWIKAVLFRKKHSKSRSSKNGSNDKRVSVRASEDPEGDSLVISSPRRLPQHETSNVGYENGTPTSISTATSFAASQSMESRSYSVLLSDADKQTQNQAAAKAQAAFRGYLARRAFRALKGIIRLQAVIRGHLVRRQAVATLFCMQAIVKLQAVVRRQNVNVEAKSIPNHAANVYLLQLLRAVPTAMPLSFQYEDSNLNSSSSWLVRWSCSRFWAPPTLMANEVPSVKHHKKAVGDAQAIENDPPKSKRNGRRGADHAVNGDKDNSVVEMKRNMKRGGSNHHLADPVPEHHPQYELERIKRNLRKVSAPAPEKVEALPEKPQQHVEIAAISAAAAEDEPAAVDAAEDEIERNVDEVVTEELMSPKEDETVRNRRSVPGKTESSSPLQNTPPSLPSYMAATQSAKAKLRASGGSSELGVEAVGHIRRHSLPVSGNGKLSSISPRIQVANGKGGNKINRSMVSSSRDDKVVVQPGWRR